MVALLGGRLGDTVGGGSRQVYSLLGASVSQQSKREEVGKAQATPACPPTKGSEWTSLREHVHLLLWVEPQDSLFRS